MTDSPLEEYMHTHRQVVGDFAQKVAQFNAEIVQVPIPDVPRLMSNDRAEFRAKFIEEELSEFRRAQQEGNLEEAVDALIDMTYVALGAMNEMGVAVKPAFFEVHAANMKKQRGSLSKRPGANGFDAVKPKDWVGPSHAQLLTITRADIEAILAARVRPLASRPKLLIMGYAQHGKDTVCELLFNKYDFSFASSSWFCAEKIIMPAVENNQPYPWRTKYSNIQECYEDRVNNRELWYELITQFNTPDLTRLGREIFKRYDVYCGLRNIDEFKALKQAKVFDYAIWVDRSKVMPPEAVESCTVHPALADYILDNNSTYADLCKNVDVLMSDLLAKY